ncbi:glyoxylase-like metal-dependent hydrolase (beta-lactamase superfamily II) [Rubricella aquisinus]|uniref:Glyoxylase-like metal-dependent hydrolase (Beta-lactamase superfamily II) n=1 Tax=Rubricella aquisinus TaxID=2028108 RepID=A0A840WZY1_9RHOB|nr:MBL fold metallo-hydrolase [Rubricella aquisinus]MBB5516710.1 glyoxylase-like metal-dependent hydrolase (beta-lactamase superfamily II) [Rubricella aquisinus]
MTPAPDDLIRFPYDTAPGPGSVIEVAPGVLWARLPLPMTLDHVNLYALEDGDGWTLIDTGINTRACRAAMEALLAGPLAGKPVRRVILTHHHPDHIGLAGWFAEQGAEIWATRTAWLFGRMLTLDQQPQMTAQAETFFRRSGMPEEMLAERKAERPFNFADVVHPIPVGFTRIKQGDLLRIGARDWRVEIGHGHAPEQATLWSEDGLILSADQILPGISPNLGVYATEPEADPVGEWMESCERLRGLVSGTELVLPGHKLPFTGVAARLDQLIDNHVQGIARLRAFLAEPRRATDCFTLLFRRKIDKGSYGLALVEAVAHMNHLHALGETTRTLGPDGAWRWQMRS